MTTMSKQTGLLHRLWEYNSWLDSSRYLPAVFSVGTALISIALLRIISSVVLRQPMQPERLDGEDLFVRNYNRPFLTSPPAQSADPAILAKHSTIGPVTTARFVYPSVRLVYCQHPKSAKLPDDIPLLVFVHGLGGSAAQFVPLLSSLSNVANCLLIDLPGCGRSALMPSDNAAYTLTAFAELVFASIQRFRQAGQKVVLVGHSLGCSVNALLASESSPSSNLLVSEKLLGGVIAICPRAEEISESQKQSLRRLKYMPMLLFDAFRLWDKRGGLKSGSISRFIGKDADLESKKLQQKYNNQSKTPTLFRFLQGLGRSDSHWPGQEIWAGINVPIFLIAAEADTVVSPKAMDQIVKWLMQTHNREDPTTKAAESRATESAAPAATGEAEAEIKRLIDGEAPDAAPSHDDASMAKVTIKHETVHHAHAIKTTMFPDPAAHGVMYSTATARPLASLIQNFLASHVDSRLSAAWQLKYMSTAGKWEVKNLNKWKKVEQISGVIAGRFRAMKTMREVDEDHCPKAFVQSYGFHDADGAIRKDGVGVVIDISHDTPVYDPAGLEDSGVRYHKFPTVSKLPPTQDEVAGYIDLINRLGNEDDNVKQGASIATHCHYGFNRTGFFLVSYLVEQLGWPIRGAIAEFKDKRPPGIKHDYFIDELYLRYGVHIERNSTLVG